MTLLALIRKGVLSKAATIATIATQQQRKAATVAKVATIAVASSQNHEIDSSPVRLEVVSELEPFDREASEKEAAITVIAHGALTVGRLV